MSYTYRYEPSGILNPVLFLFHGTGGDENQLMGLGKQVGSEFPIISPRGKHREGEALRFFRRFEEGHLDVDDLKFRATEIAAWIREALSASGLEGRKTIALGYSNGASISGGIALGHPNAFDALILLRPMVPYLPESNPDLTGKKVLILASQTDTICPFDGAVELGEILTSAGAEVQFESVPGAHGLTEVDAQKIQSFLAQFRTIIA
jgi:phospholipase/carboxylesterase